MKHSFGKRLGALLLALCLAVGLLPPSAFAAETRAAIPGFTITLDNESKCAWYHGNDLDYFVPKDHLGGRGAYCEEGNIVAEPYNGGQRIRAKERARFKNSDLLVQPFKINVEVPAYTSYTITFDVYYSIRRNSDGAVWYFLELFNNSSGTGDSHYNVGNNANKSAPNSVGRINFSDRNGGGAKFTFAGTFNNFTGETKTVTRPMGYYVGASKSKSILSRNHHQTESSMEFYATSCTAETYVARVPDDRPGAKDRYASVHEAASRFNFSPDQTIELLTDCTDEIALLQPGTVDLNGHSYAGKINISCHERNVFEELWDTITIQNGTLKGGRQTSDNTETVISTDYDILELRDVTFRDYTNGVSSKGKIILGGDVTFQRSNRSWYDFRLYPSARFHLGAELNNNSTRIQVYAISPGDITTTNPRVLVDNWTAVMGDKDPGKYFAVNNGALAAVVENGKAVIKPNGVTFDANGGTVSPTSVGLSGGKVAVLPTPVKPGCTFEGWYDNADFSGSALTPEGPFTAGTTLYAKWSSTPVTVSFDLNGAEGEAPGSLATETGVKYVLPEADPAREKYNFLGWYTAESGGEQVTDETVISRAENHTLYAHWERETYAVTFDVNYDDGNNITRKIVTGEAVGALPLLGRNEYVLEGWYTAAEGGDPIDAATVPTENTTYYAHWRERQAGDPVNVTLNPNCGTLPADAETTFMATPGKPYPAEKLLTPEREGYEFAGWYVDPKIDEAATTVREAHHSIFAHWTPKTFTVTFNANGGTFASGETVIGETVTVESTYGQGYGMPEEELTPPAGSDNNIFTGWYTLAEGGELVTSGTVCELDGPQTLYAHWGTAHTHKTHTKAGSETEFTYRLTQASFDNSTDGVINGNTLREGNYYLAEDIAVTPLFFGQYEKTINLCLNGHAIKITGTSLGIRVETGTINICDCRGHGKVDGTASGGCLTLNGGAVNLYSGTLDATSYTGSDTETRDLVRMEGGTLTVDGAVLKANRLNAVNTRNNYRTVIIRSGCVESLRKAGVTGPGNFTVEGGSVSGRTYGVFVSGGAGSLRLSGSSTISGDTADIWLTGGSTTIAVGEDLEGVYSITKSSNSPVTVASSEDHSDHFVAYDSARYHIENSGSGNAQVVMLKDEGWRKHIHDGNEYSMLNLQQLVPSSSQNSFYFLRDDTVTRFPHEAGDVPAGKSVELCLNGKTLTKEDSSFYYEIGVYGTLTIRDCSSDASGSIERINVYTGGKVYFVDTPTFGNKRYVYLSGDGKIAFAPDMTPTHPIPVSASLSSNKPSMVITSGWSDLGEGAEPEAYLRYAGSEKAVLAEEDGEVVLRRPQVTLHDGTVKYVDYEGKLKSEDRPDDRLPSAPGQKWDGWYTAPEGGEKVNIYSYVFTQDTTLYPCWKPCEHIRNSNPLTTVNATCTAEGYNSYTCYTCKAAVTEIIPQKAHTFKANTWGKNETTHWKECTVCKGHFEENAHIWGEGVKANHKITYTCESCAQTREEAVPTYSASFEVDKYTGAAPAAITGKEAGEQITLPIDVTRTGYTLAGWVLLDETGTPADTVSASPFTMPGRNVTFRVKWERAASCEPERGEPIVLEDGTTITKEDDNTVTITQPPTRNPDGTETPGQTTTVTLPEGETGVTVVHGEDGKDQVILPPESQVTTGDGPTVTIGGGNADGSGNETGAVDSKGTVEAPTGSSVTDPESGNTVTITEGDGVISAGGNVSFPPTDPSDPGTGGGAVSVTDKDGTVTGNIPVGGETEGVDLTTGQVPPDGPDNQVGLDNGTVITLPEDTANDPTTGGVSENADGSVPVPGGSTVKTPDGTVVKLPENGEGGAVGETGGVTLPAGSTATMVVPSDEGVSNEITVTVPEGESGGSISSGGDVTLPAGGTLTIPTEGGGSTEIEVPENGGTIEKTDAGFTAPQGSEITTTDPSGTSQTTQVTEPGGSTVQPSLDETPSPAPAPGEGYSINYTSETITVQPGYEVRTGNHGSGEPVNSGGKLTPGDTLYIRKSRGNGQNPSNWVEVTIPDRGEAPAGVTPVAETAPGAKDGKLTGVSALMEYSADDGVTWKACSGTEVTPLVPGSYQVRFKATTNAFASQAVTVTVPAKTHYVVAFNSQGGTDLEDQPVEVGGKATKPDDPTREGYIFDGWFTDEGCTREWNFDAVVTGNMTLYAKWIETYEISGQVTEGEDAAEGAVVTLMRGGVPVDLEGNPVTVTDGRYSFTGVLPGKYNVVAVKGTKIMTSLVTITNADVTEDLEMPSGDVNSKLVVQGTQTPAVVVGGLDDEAEAKAESGKTVTITMTVESKPDAANADDIREVAAGKTLDFLEITVTKTVDSVDEPPLSETNTLLEIVIPFDSTGKKNVTVYRHHGTSAEMAKLTQKPAEGSRTEGFILGDGQITIYAKNFSTYAIGYETEGDEPTPPTGGSGASSYTPTIRQPEHGKITATPTWSQEGGKVTITVTPEDGYTVGTVTVTDKDGKPVEVTKNADGTYTFTQPAGQVTISATMKQAVCDGGNACPAHPFTDLDLTRWYHNGIHFCVEHGLMAGTSATTFAPEMPTSRAMLTTILWRLRGSPVVNYALRYDDVAEGAWYTEAVRWATSEGVVDGYGNGKFGPDDPVTREQLAAMLWRYVGRPESGNTLDRFADGGKTSSWATPALCWAVEQGIVAGRGNGILAPTGTATRAEAAAMIQRFYTTGEPA